MWKVYQGTCGDMFSRAVGTIKMKLKKETIIELDEILTEEFKLSLNNHELEKLAYCLIGYFNLLLRIEIRKGVQK